MNGLIKQIEKGKPFFEKISRNIYLSAICDGFLTAMPAILFSSVFILVAALPEVFGFAYPAAISTWLWKVYGYTMGIIGIMVAATTARCLADAMNRQLPKGKNINTTSVMLASVSSFLLLAAAQNDGGIMTGFAGTKGLLASFIAAFITVNVYKFCVIKDITIKMPKEVPGTISQAFRDVFPFSFAVGIAALIDAASTYFFKFTFCSYVVIFGFNLTQL